MDEVTYINQSKYIFVTGGVLSSLGKGLLSASVGSLLESQGHTVTFQKLDPYLNIDPGTMNPYQHGEVYVTDDGAETDMDMGHYERFTSSNMSQINNYTTGRIYQQIIEKERRGEYNGGTVQVIPHVTDEIKQAVLQLESTADIIIVEIGGTVGDIEGLPFMEAIRQLGRELGEKSIFIHLTLVPYLTAAGEMKTKPTQHSIKELLGLGICPDILVCRTDRDLDENIKRKLSLFCNVHINDVITAKDVASIYEVPLNLHNQKLDERITKKLLLKPKHKADVSEWGKISNILTFPKYVITIALIGKYTELKEAYKSLHEALVHGGVANKAKVEIKYINSENLEEDELLIALKGCSGIIVPGGFGTRGIHGKLRAIKIARTHKIPFFGICLGMQLAVIEYARNVCGIYDATSTEFSDSGSHVFYLMEKWYDPKNNTHHIRDVNSNIGGTLRLGTYACHLVRDTLAHTMYAEDIIYERHRHRYEFNADFMDILSSKGLCFSGISSDQTLVEIIEYTDNHPWFLGCQFHPEFKSKPRQVHPLFQGFIAASINYNLYN